MGRRGGRLFSLNKTTAFATQTPCLGWRNQHSYWERRTEIKMQHRGGLAVTNPPCDLTESTLPTATSECHSQLLQRRDCRVSPDTEHPCPKHRAPTPAHSAHRMLSTLAFQQNPQQLLYTHTCPSCSEPEEEGWHSRVGRYAKQHNKVKINCSHSPQNQSYS